MLMEVTWRGIFLRERERKLKEKGVYKKGDDELNCVRWFLKKCDE